MPTHTTTLPSDDEKRRFGQQLYEARMDAGLTQRELADACGVGQNVVSTWENGHSTPKGRVPWLLCQVLGFERWRSLWGEVQLSAIPGGRLYSESEVDERARRIAADLLSEQLRTLRNEGRGE